MPSRLTKIALFPLLLALSACSAAPIKEKTTKTYLPVSTIAPLTDRAAADFYFIEGDLLSREGKSAEAIELFKKVISLDNTALAAHLHLAAEYHALGDIPKAIGHAKQAIELNPKNLTARFTLADLYTLENSYDQALRQYQTILKMHPRHGEAMLLTGATYAAKKDFKNAEQAFKALLKNPDYGTPYLAHYYLGRMYQEQKGLESEIAAEAAFKRTLDLRPGFEDAVASLAKLYLAKKKPQQALALCEAFQNNQRFSSQIAELITEIHTKNGNLDRAYEQLETLAGNFEPSIDLKLKMALNLIESKRYHLAAAKLNDILTALPNLDSARYYLAAVHEASGDFDNAIRNFMLVPPTSKHFTEAVVHTAHLLKGQGKINEALNITSQGLKVRADSPLYLIRASLLGAKSDYQGAVQLLEEGLNKYAHHTELLFQHAVMLDRLGQKEAMIGQIKKLLEINPDHVQGMSYLAFSWAELNQNLANAEELARRASELSPDDGYVLDTLGWVLVKQKKYSEAIPVLEKAYKHQPSSLVIAKHLADAHASLKTP